MKYLYIDEFNKPHLVSIHNFGTTVEDVRIIGGINLNPADKNYPDKKWVKASELYMPATFSEDLVKKLSFNK